MQPPDIPDANPSPVVSREHVQHLDAADLGGPCECHSAGLTAALHALLDPVFLLNAVGTVVAANESAVQWLGALGACYIGLPWQQIAGQLRVTYPDGRPLAPLAQPSELMPWPSSGPFAVQTEVWLHRDQSDVPDRIMVSAAVERRHGVVTGALVLCRDVTSFAGHEREKDEFVCMATHELKTPISTLRGYAQMAEARANRLDAPDVAMSISKIIRQADRLTRLVADLLDVSRIHTGHIDLRIAETDVVRIVREAVEHQRAVHPGRCFQFDYNVAVAVVHADGSRVEQVLTNLLDNAVKYSPEGGPVFALLEVGADEVLVAVTDRGIGIPVEEQGQLFQRFYRAKSGAHRVSGLGVGLYISYRIILEHGGRMWVRSNEEGGTTFGFTLPLRYAPHA